MDTIYGATITTEGAIEFLTEPVAYRTMSDTVGGLITPVTCPHGDTVYVNDDGLLMGMERNVGAMLVAMHEFLVGDAIVCGPLDGEGEHTPLTPEVVTFLRRLAS